MRFQLYENSGTYAADEQLERLPSRMERLTLRTRGGELVLAIAQNVSLDGIGLQLKSSQGLKAANEVDVLFRATAIPAIVKYVECYPDGMTVAGLEWVKPLSV